MLTMASAIKNDAANIANKGVLPKTVYDSHHGWLTRIPTIIESNCFFLFFKVVTNINQKEPFWLW